MTLAPSDPANACPSWMAITRAYLEGELPSTCKGGGRKPNHERNAAIEAMIRAGTTRRDVSVAFGISVERVRQLAFMFAHQGKDENTTQIGGISVA